MQIAKEIIEAFIAGEQEAFRHIYETTKKPIFGVIFRLVGNQHDAEDILHDVYMRVYEKRSLYKQDKSALSTWIYRLAVNFTLNVLKKKKRWHQDLVAEPVSEDILETYLAKSDTELAQQVLEKINPDFKICLVLREIEEKSYEEIADLLQLSPGTVKSRINRGRQQLKELFNKIDRR